MLRRGSRNAYVSHVLSRRRGKIERAEEFEAVNDDQAIKTARLMNKSVWFEVWERGRRVAQVEYPESRETPPERPRCQQP